LHIIGRILAAVVMIAAVDASAQTGETPPTLEGAKTITARDAKAAIDAGAQPLDVRKKASFVEGRLPKAKAIGTAKDPKTNEFNVAVFGTKKDAAVLFYGHGSDGWSAVAAVNSAVKAGFTNVLWLRGGYTEWAQAGLPIEQ